MWTVQLPIAYPSDPQQLGPDLYLVADYTKPGGILEFTREGRIVWTYRPTGGDGHARPSEPGRAPAQRTDRRERRLPPPRRAHRPATNTIVWQYGQTDEPGTGPDQLNTPDGFDLLLPDGTTPTHPQTG